MSQEDLVQNISQDRTAVRNRMKTTREPISHFPCNPQLMPPPNYRPLIPSVGSKLHELQWDPVILIPLGPLHFYSYLEGLLYGGKIPLKCYLWDLMTLTDVSHLQMTIETIWEVHETSFWWVDFISKMKIFVLTFNHSNLDFLVNRATESTLMTGDWLRGYMTKGHLGQGKLAVTVFECADFMLFQPIVACNNMAAKERKTDGAFLLRLTFWPFELCHLNRMKIARFVCCLALPM